MSDPDLASIAADSEREFQAAMATSDVGELRGIAGWMAGRTTALLAEVEQLREQLARTQEREAQHARIVVAVERIAGDLDGAGPVDGSKVAAQLRAAYQAGAEER